jgi:hypothetical protein
MNDAWSGLSRDVCSLAFEASQVMALRTFALAIGGACAETEMRRMIDEKVKALIGALGFTTPDIAARSVAHYRHAVRSNRRRLLARKTWRAPR